jgi:signal transduction histidine kinase
LLNLYKNAVEAMPGGGTIFLRGTGQDDHVVLEVQDTGAGIPEGVDVFEPFVTTKEYGTGLGLPLVRQIVSAHGGTVACASEPGKGTTFRLALPSRPKK